MAKDVLIRGRTRTPVGECGRALRDLSTIGLGPITARVALERTKVSPNLVDRTVMASAFRTPGASRSAPLTPYPQPPRYVW